MLRRMLCAALLLALCLTGAALADEAALLDAYDLISPLGNGMYAVRRDGLWGIAGETGEVALEVQLEQEPVFEDGRAVVTSAAGKERLSGVDAFFGGAGDQGRCGVIDEEGRVRVPFEYDYIQIRDGVALAMRDEKYSYFDLNGDPISRESYDYADGFIGDYAKVGKSDGFALSFGVIDRAGAEVVPLEFNDIRLSEDGAAAARRSTGEKYGFIDMRGDWVIEPKFDSAEPFKNGCAAVGMESKDKSYEAWDYGIACDWGLIDAQGDEILPMAYDFVNVRDDGIIETSVFDGEMNKVRWFEISGGWAVEVDAPPEEPEPPRSEPLDNPRPAKGRAGDGALFVERRDGRWRLTDASGEAAVDEVFLNERGVDDHGIERRSAAAAPR